MATSTVYLGSHISGVMSRRASDLSYPARVDVTPAVGDIEDPRLRFARVVRDARKQRGWKQEDLAAHAGVSVPTIQRWETGKTGTPDPENARKVFHALGLDSRWIPVLLGYITAEEMGLPPEPPRVFSPDIESVIRTLEDDTVPIAVKRQWMRFLEILAADEVLPREDGTEHRRAG